MNTSKRILLVEDDEAVLDSTKEYLETLGYEVVPAFDGKNASDILIDDDNFDVIFSDLNMPEMDGTVLFEYIKNNPELKEIPFVMTSGDIRMERYLKLRGVAGFILKGQPGENLLKNTIEKVLADKAVS